MESDLNSTTQREAKHFKKYVNIFRRKGAGKNFRNVKKKQARSSEEKKREKKIVSFVFMHKACICSTCQVLVFAHG